MMTHFDSGSRSFLKTRVARAKRNAVPGFTLIELLVVIAIISLLSSVVLASLNTARGKARDASRAESVHTLALDLQLYYDKYGCAPLTTNANTCGAAAGVYNEGASDGDGGWDNSSVGTFMSFLTTSGVTTSVAVDPTNNYARGKFYRYYCYASANASNAAGCTAGGACLLYYNEAGTQVTYNDASMSCK